MRVTICILLAAVVSVLAFNGCQDPFNSTSSGPQPQPGMGVFSLTIAGQDPARTIAPVWPSGITYNLAFVPNSACTSGNLPVTVDNWQREPIDLDFGLWDLTVAAYVDVEGNLKRIAEGVLTGINITDIDPVVSGEVRLSPVTGDGTFEWNIITTGVQLDTAKMVITPVGGASLPPFYFEGFPGVPSGAQTVTNPGSLLLSAGEYRVVFTLTNENDQRAVLREVLHVHANMTSYFSQAIGDEHFPTSLLDMILSGWDDSANKWDFDFGRSGIITAAHFGHLGIHGIEYSNFNNIVDAFNTLTAANQPPEDLDDLKALTDAALIELGAASHLETGYVRRSDAQDAISALALNGTLIPDSAFNWSPDRVTITAGGYTSEFSITATIYDHIVTFVPNGGTGANVAIRVSGNTINLDGGNRGFSRTLHDHVGWAESAVTGTDNPLAPIAPSGEHTVSADTTLHAVWYRPEYFVSFDANGGTGGTLPAAIPVLRGNYATLPGFPLASLANHHFVGWNAQSDGAGMTNLAGGPFRMMDGDVTLYAEWAENPVSGGANPPPGIFTVTLLSNGGDGVDGGPTSFTLLGAPTVMALPIGGFTRTDHIFIGWSETAVGGIILPGGAPFDVVGDTTLYARWLEVPIVDGVPTPPPFFTVTLAPNGGSGAEFALTPVPGGTTIALPGGGFTRQWHDQVGWGSTSLAVGAPPAYLPGAPITVTADMTLHAVWYRPTDTISFEGNGATSGSADPMSGLRGTTITLPGATAFAWPGNDLVGWSPLSGLGGNFFGHGTTFTINGTATLFARWEVPSVTDVTVTPSPATVIRGQTSEPFTATVVGTGNVIATVTWATTPERVDGNPVHGGTSFNSTTRILTVSAYEPPGEIRVRAMADHDNTTSGYALVTVPHPTVTGVTIDAPLTRVFDRDDITPAPIQFNATVTGVGNPQPAHFTLAWTVEGAASPGTAINAIGLLNVPRTETNSSLTVRVTATANVGGSSATEANPATVTIEGTIPVGDWRQVSVGIDHTVAIDWEGRMWAWGMNMHGQLGNGEAGAGSNRNRPVRVTVSGNYDSDVWVQVDAGWAHTVAMRNDGTIWGWGNIWSAGWGGTDNIVATMGTGSNTTGLRPAPIPGSVGYRWRFVAASHSNVFAIREDGALFSMGRNQQGQLGRGEATGGTLDTLEPVTTSHTDWTYISASQGHVMALRENGELWAWGLNGDGQLGRGANNTVNSAVPIQVAGTFYRVAAGTNFSVGIDMVGRLLTWGGNANGQLGTGNTTADNSNAPVVRPIDIGSQTWSFVRMGQTSHVLAVTSGGEIWSWGNNNLGQVGTGVSGGNVVTPARRENFVDVDGNPVTVGRFATSIAGGSFSLAIQEDGRMFAWGHNTFGMLGLGFFSPDIPPNPPNNNGFVGNPTLVLPQ